MISSHATNSPVYEFSAGRGKSSHGAKLSALSQDNVAGREVLALLKRSFEQQMTFTIGTSLTTGTCMVPLLGLLAHVSYISQRQCVCVFVRV